MSRDRRGRGAPRLWRRRQRLPRRTRQPYPCRPHSRLASRQTGAGARRSKSPKARALPKRHPDGTPPPAAGASHKTIDSPRWRRSRSASNPPTSPARPGRTRRPLFSTRPRYRELAPSRGRATQRPASERTSELNLFDVDFVPIVDPQAKLGGVLDVPGLADEALDVGIVTVALAALDVRAVPHGIGALGFALVVDDVEQEPVDRDRIGSKHHLLRIEAKLVRIGKGTAVPDAPQAIHDLQRSDRAQRFDHRQSSDEGERVGLLIAMRAGHVAEVSVGNVLEAPGDAGCAVILHIRNVDDLGKAFGDEANQVRARILFAEEIDLDVSARIIVGHLAARVFGGDNIHA